MQPVPYVLPSPIHFASSMREYWERTLGNAWSPALEKVWISMASAFGRAIIDFDQPTRVWHVLQPPTGTGKTQGTCVYCSLVARQNKSSQAKLGVLLVTRQIKEADGLARTINELAGTECAIAKHSASRVTQDEARKHDVLIITHSAYIRALDAKMEDDDDRWSSLMHWTHGERRLTIIDESLSDIIINHQITSRDVQFVLSVLDHQLKTNHPWAVTALETIANVLAQIAEKVEAAADGDLSSYLRSSRIVWRSVQDGQTEFPSDLGIGILKFALGKLPFDKLVLRRESSLDRERLRQRVEATLIACEAILSSWAFYAKKGQDHTLNASKLLLPSDLPSPVILDATASQNFLWELMGERVVRHGLPSNPRSYSSVRLHVARASGLGKTKMQALAKERFPRIIDHIQRVVGSDRSVLVCTHKLVEHHAKACSSDFKSFDVAHWGDIDGRNDWQEFDTVVLCGLSYRDDIWATNAFIALQGLPDNDWMQKPEWKGHEDIRQEMQVKQLSVSIIQAINRIRCRRVIDAMGNCQRADVFLFLPKTQHGDAILSNIVAEMPNIDVIDWQFNLDEPSDRPVRKGSVHEGLLTMVRNAEPGEISLSTIRDEFDLKKDSYKSLLKTLKDADHPLTKQLGNEGVVYVSGGKGRGAKSYLLKQG